MSPLHPTRTLILQTLVDGEPKSSDEIAVLTRKSPEAIGAALRRCWTKSLVLRSKKPFRESFNKFKGRAGMRRNLRSYYLYTLRLNKTEFFPSGNCNFVNYEEWMSGSNRELQQSQNHYGLSKSQFR